MDSQTKSADAMADLGALALGSRLRRLADALYRDAAQSLENEAIALAPNHIPVLMTLHRDGPMSVADLSARLGVSQPGVTRMVSQLRDRGVAQVDKPADDQRRTHVSLSPTGAGLMDEISGDYCRRVAEAAHELYADTAPDFLAQLAEIERALRSKSLSDRIASKAAE